jgi:hypothetical protein
MSKEEKSRILSIDPGEMTGISYVEDGRFVWGMTCVPECFDSEDFILGIVKMTKPTTIVIESPPAKTSFYNKEQYHIFDLLTRMYRIAGFAVEHLNPGQWKHLVARTPIDGTHMRDAADMAKVKYTMEQAKK